MEEKRRGATPTIVNKRRGDRRSCRMPFMIGKEPVRRTLKYLMAGKLVLKDKIQILSINYNTHTEHHKGTR